MSFLSVINYVNLSFGVLLWILWRVKVWWKKKKYVTVRISDVVIDHCVWLITFSPINKQRNNCVIKFICTIRIRIINKLFVVYDTWNTISSMTPFDTLCYDDNILYRACVLNPAIFYRQYFVPNSAVLRVWKINYFSRKKWNVLYTNKFFEDNNHVHVYRLQYML